MDWVRVTTFGLILSFAASTACLSTSYEIPKDELAKLVYKPADRRGEKVHVIQRWTFERSVEPYYPASGEAQPVVVDEQEVQQHIDTALEVMTYLEPEPEYENYSSGQATGSSTSRSVVVVSSGQAQPGKHVALTRRRAPAQAKPNKPTAKRGPYPAASTNYKPSAGKRIAVSASRTPHKFRKSANLSDKPITAFARGRKKGIPKRTRPNFAAHKRAYRTKRMNLEQKKHALKVASKSKKSGSSGTVPNFGSSSKDKKSSADEIEALAIAVVAAAIVGTVALAASEGARFNGWVSMAPDQPIHLIKTDGTEEIVPLYDLQLSDLDNLDEAVVLENELDGLVRLKRAPLDRVGFTWQCDLGMQNVVTKSGKLAHGIGATLAIGFYPANWLGLLAFLTAVPEATGDVTATMFRYGLEADLMLIRFRKLWLGPFAQYGYSSVTSDDWSVDRASVGVGGKLELELTTYLSLYGKVTAHNDFMKDELSPTAVSASVGLAIY